MASILEWFAIPSSSEPCFLRTLHHDPSNLGGPAWHGSKLHLVMQAPLSRQGCDPWRGATWAICIFWYILEINPLLVALFANIFPHSVGCLFLSFAVHKLLNWTRSLFFIFVIIFITLGGGFKKISLWLCQSVFPAFSSTSFIVSDLTFMFLIIHFECIFVYLARECSNLILLCAFPAVLIEQTVFSPLCILASFVVDELIIGVWVYIWVLCPVPLSCMSVFVPVPYCFDYGSFIV